MHFLSERIMGKPRKLTFVSAFAGIGGFDLAFARAGMKCLAQIECDPQCLSVLRRHSPKTKRFKDIRDFNRASIAVRPDIICGGFPCQDLSVAGRRAGLSGERSGLFFEFMRVVAEFAPDSVCIENVPGLLSGCGCPLCRVVAERLRQHLERERQSNPMARDCGCGECRVGQELHKAHSGRNFAIVVAALVKLGYGVSMRVLDAQWFGVPQRRERVFIVGCLGNIRRACEILFERESLPWDSPPRREAWARSAAGPAVGAASGSGVNRPRRGDRDADKINPPSDVSLSLNGHSHRYQADNSTFVRGPIQAHAAEHGHAMTTQQAAESGHLVAAPLDTKPYADHEAKESRLVVEAIPLKEVDARTKCDPNRHGDGIGTNGDVMYPLESSHEHGIAHTLRAEGHDASEDGTGRGVPLVPMAFYTTQITSRENGSNPQPGGPCHPLAAGAHAPAVAYRTSGNCGVMEQRDKTAALTTATDPTATIIYQCQGSNVGPMGTLKGKNHTAGVPFTFQPRIGRNGRGQPDELCPALTGSEAGDTCDSRPCVAIPQMAVRRLMPVECERLQGFPETEYHTTIEVCVGQPKRPVNADAPSRKSQRHVGNVVRNIPRGVASFAARYFTHGDQSASKRAPLVAHIFYAPGEVLALNPDGSCLFAGSAANESEFPLPMPLADFVRQLAGISITADHSIRHGAAESRLSAHCSIHHLDGARLVRLSGDGTMQRANGVSSDSNTECGPTRSTTRSHSSSGDTERRLRTSFSSVLAAISGFIHSPILAENSFRIEISVSLGWTEIGVDRLGGCVELSDSARYRMLGNAVAIPKVEWIGRRMVKAHRKARGDV